MKKKISGVLFLVGAALIWGFAFVAQKEGLNYVGPFTLTATRCFAGGLFLFIVSLVLDLVKKHKHKGEELPKEEKVKNRKNLIVGGLVCGFFITIATNLQQIGLVYTTPGKSGFITACYIVLVPILGLFLKKKSPFTVWVAVVLAVVGLYLLCLSGKTNGINKGDWITLCSAVMFASHILSVDKFIEKAEGIKLTYIQCFVCSFVSAIFMFIFEKPNINAILKAIVPILYAGIFSSGVAYLFQMLGQKRLSPAVASLIMSAESVISVLAGWLILHQTLTTREIIGCVVIFVAIILAQIPIKINSKKSKNIEEIETKVEK